MSSENIDEFAQEYFDRAHKRREVLAVKLAEISSRKRTVPLAENQDLNISPTKKQDDDSPNKRQCVRAEELIKPDTPAIPSVKSRLKDLVSERKNWQDDSIPVDPAPLPTSKLASLTSPVKDLSPTPVARKSRFAALAQSINNWEDDPKHVLIKKEEKSKKTWEPPKPVESATTTEPTGRDCEPMRRVRKSGPPKPERMHDQETNENRAKSRSPVRHTADEESKNEGINVTSSLSVTLTAGKKDQAASKVKNSSPKKVREINDQNKFNAEEVCQKALTKSAPVRSASPVKPGIANRMAALQQDANKRRDSFEPSAQPVAARLADWQERVRRVEEESNSTYRVRTQSKTKFASPTKATPTSDTKSRTATWNKKVQDEERTATVSQSVITNSPAKSPGKPASATSPIKSPTKIAPAAKTIQAKLQQLQESWKQNEIAEQIKQQRQNELAVLQNRWKNGVLNEDQYTVENQPKPNVDRAVVTQPGVVPPPPPLPQHLPGSPQKTESSTSRPCPVKSASKSTSKKRPISEEARNKIRAVHQQMVEMVMGEENGSGQLTNRDSNFEDKLKTLGFEIEAKPEVGQVAVLDLKEQREKDRLRREAEKNQKQSPRKPAVKIIEETVTSCKFGEEKVTTQVKVKEGDTPVAVHTSSATAPGGSLYSLIQKKTAQTPNLVQTPSRSTPVKAKLFHDSFSSDEDGSTDDPSPTTVTITTTVKRRPSTGSEYSNSQTGTTQSDDEYSSTESSMEDTEATTQSEYGDVETSVDESQGVCDISDLLEEAMDDTECESTTSADKVKPPSPVYVARKLPPEAHPGHPGHRSKAADDREQPEHRQVQLRHPPPKYPRQPQQQRDQRRVAFTSPGGSTYQPNSDDEYRREIVHSIDNYRNSVNTKINAPEPRLKIIRRSQHFDSDDCETMSEASTVSQQSVQQQLQRRTANPRLESYLQELQELVNQEQNIIKQASNALNQCLITDATYAGHDRIVECHRLLLQACKKREAYLAEMERIRTGRRCVPSGPKGSLSISNITLPLKQDFVARKRRGQEMDTIHYFVVLFRQGAHVIFTQMVSTDDELVNNSLQIPNMLPMIEIRQNFRIDVEIYSMSIGRETEVDKTPKKKKGLTPKKFMSASKRHNPAYQSAGGPSAVSTSNFAFIAGFPITLSSVNTTCFSLDKVPFSSPLHGTINLKLTCLLEALIEEKGFLTMFEDVSGLGNWHRRWCVLKHNVLAYWKYPDDAKFKEPIGTIDLKYCITNEVGLIPRDVCARPNTFELVTVRRQQRGDSDTLVSQCYNTMTTTKHWLSADTKEDRYVWCHKLNEALRNLRTWNPDALRPIKIKDTGV